MNKTQLASAIAKKSGLSNKDCVAVINAFMDVVKESLQNGDSVSLIGFGTFSVKDRAARKGFNPKTKEEIDIPASKAPAFKAGKVLKDCVNK